MALKGYVGKTDEYVVYMHTSPSGKRYIGITSICPATRWARGNGYVNNTHFSNAILKYGWDNIRHEILCRRLTKEQAKEKEIELIAEYDAANNKRGYNKTAGGDTNVPLFGEANGMYGKSHTGGAREKMSKAALMRLADKENHPMYGKPRSEETKRKISESRKGKYTGEQCYFYGKNKSGKDSWRYGMRHTAETKRKLSEMRKGRYMGADAYNARPVLLVETGETFSCAMDVKRQRGYDNSMISKCCKGQHKTAYGFHWEYAPVRED